MNHEKLQPLVSVIVPVYNVEKYLTRCLDSIVEQTYQKLEILLINDGSTDDSGEICRQYAERDSRIRLFHQENRGQSAARNVGLDNMTGEYIVFVDSDDYISPYLIECLLNCILEYGTLITVCGYLDVEDGDDQAVFDTIPAHVERYFRKISRDKVFDTVDKFGCISFVIQVCKLYHKKIFESLRYPKGKIHEDEFVFHKIYRQVNEIYYANLRLYAHRQTVNSTMRRNGLPDSHADIIEARWERLLFFQKYGVVKYSLATGKMLLRDYAAFADISDQAMLRRNMTELEKQIYRATGQKIFSWKYTLFKCSPMLYRKFRRIYRAAKFSLVHRRKRHRKCRHI